MDRIREVMSLMKGYAPVSEPDKLMQLAKK
jgi:hypothetical protein